MNIEQIIDRETTKLQNIVKDMMDKYQTRQSWVKSDFNYVHSGEACPVSIKEFTKLYLDGIANIVSKLDK